MKYEGKVLSFYADSKENMDGVLLQFPTTPFPNSKSQNIPINISLPTSMKTMVSGEIFEKFNGHHACPYLLANIWVVFIVDTGVGHDHEFQGLHILLISALKTKLLPTSEYSISVLKNVYTLGIRVN